MKCRVSALVIAALIMKLLSTIPTNQSVYKLALYSAKKMEEVRLQTNLFVLLLTTFSFYIIPGTMKIFLEFKFNAYPLVATTLVIRLVRTRRMNRILSKLIQQIAMNMRESWKNKTNMRLDHDAVILFAFF